MKKKPKIFLTPAERREVMYKFAYLVHEDQKREKAIASYRLKQAFLYGLDKVACALGDLEEQSRIRLVQAAVAMGYPVNAAVKKAYSELPQDKQILTTLQLVKLALNQATTRTETLTNDNGSTRNYKVVEKKRGYKFSI